VLSDAQVKTGCDPDDPATWTQPVVRVGDCAEAPFRQAANTPVRVNLRSRDRALLMLFLFFDVGQADAPTRIKVGSHLDVPPFLLPAGQDGMPGATLAQTMDQAGKLNAPDRPLALAAGAAGDVYLRTRSWSTPPSHTTAAARGSWPSHRSIPRGRWTLTAPMTPPARSNAPSATGSTWTATTPEDAASSANPTPKSPRNTFRNPALAGFPR
jgi:hypothetical protein